MNATVTEELADFASGLRTPQSAFGPASGEARGAGRESVSVESLSFADPAGAEWCMCISSLLDTRTAA